MGLVSIQRLPEYGTTNTLTPIAEIQQYLRKKKPLAGTEEERVLDRQVRAAVRVELEVYIPSIGSYYSKK